MRRPTPELRPEQRDFLEAQRCAYIEDFQQAKKLIAQLYELYGCVGPSPSAPIKLNILNGIVSARLNETEVTFAAIAAAIEGICVPNSEYAFNDKAHLIEYCRYILEFVQLDPDTMPSAGLFEAAWLRRILILIALPSTREMFPLPRGR